MAFLTEEEKMWTFEEHGVHIPLGLFMCIRLISFVYNQYNCAFLFGLNRVFSSLQLNLTSILTMNILKVTNLMLQKIRFCYI